MMRVFSFLALVALAAPAQAQLVLPPEDDRPPSRLAPIDPDGAWYPRLEAAGLMLGSVLGDGPTGQWPEFFGGSWLNAADKARIMALLGDDSIALRRVLAVPGAYEQAVLGWQPPEGGTAYAAVADRPEADAIICWREVGSEAPWPMTAAEAEDRQRHACVRISYSIRFDPPQWRAFIDAPVTAAD